MDGIEITRSHRDRWQALLPSPSKRLKLLASDACHEFTVVSARQIVR